MAMSRPGQSNAQGDAKATFLKVFAGEVLTAFREKTLMLDKHKVRTIQNGKSAQFPIMGKTGAHYMQAGDTLEGGEQQHAERVITIDDLLVSDVMIYQLDEAMNHYDIRAEYTTQVGHALANQFDRHVMQTALLAARDTEIKAGHPTGEQLTITFSEGASKQEQGRAIGDALFEAAAALDDKDVPEEDRHAVFRPTHYYKIVQSLDAINKDYGGMGAYSDGKIVKVAGITIHKSNHLPTTGITAGTTAAGTDNKYAGDFSNTFGLVFHKQAVGTVKLMDVKTESDYLIQKQGHLIVAKYALGHGILRPGCAIELLRPSNVRATTAKK